MNWPDKLRQLITAVEQGHPLVRGEFYYNPPLEPANIAPHVHTLPFNLPSALHELYFIVDGMFIATNYRISGLVSSRPEVSLDTLNRDYLADVRELCQEFSVWFIFGSTTQGEFLCVTEPGAVISVYSHGGEEAKLLANSIDEFFDSVCLGSEFIRYHSPTASKHWLPILQELGFIGLQ